MSNFEKNTLSELIYDLASRACPQYGWREGREALMKEIDRRWAALEESCGEKELKDFAYKAGAPPTSILASTLPPVLDADETRLRDLNRGDVFKMTNGSIGVVLRVASADSSLVYVGNTYEQTAAWIPDSTTVSRLHVFEDNAATVTWVANELPHRAFANMEEVRACARRIIDVLKARR